VERSSQYLVIRAESLNKEHERNKKKHESNLAREIIFSRVGFDSFFYAFFVLVVSVQDPSYEEDLSPRRVRFVVIGLIRVRSPQLHS